MKFIVLCLCIFLQCTILQARETVVLIHGFLLAHFHMVPIKRALHCDNFDICNFEYPSRQNTIYGHSMNLVDTLQYIARQKPGEAIHFVTHSIGGLILRSALNLPGCPHEAKIGRCVLLASPNQGSSLGRQVQSWPGIGLIFGDKAGRELLTWGPEEVRCLGEFPPCMRILSIAGSKGIKPFFDGRPNDRFLLVEETYLNTPHTHIILKMSHGELINRRQSLEKIREFLLCCD